MTLSHVNAGDQLLAADINGVIDGVNALDASHTFSGLVTANGSPTSITAAHDVTVNGTLNSNGTLNGNTVQFTVGSITRLSIFTGSANNTGTLQAHGLGVKPDFVAILETQASGDTNTFSWDVGASDATNIKVWTLNATARTYTALAIKL